MKENLIETGEEFHVFINKCRFFAHHGVLEHERTAGNEFEVSVDALLKGKSNLLSNQNIEEETLSGEDNLSSTVSYVDIYNICKEEMEIPRNLLETVARRIGCRLISEFTEIREADITITKKTPPIPGFTGEAGTKFHISRRSPKDTALQGRENPAQPQGYGPSGP